MTQTESDRRVLLAGLWIPGRARPKGSMEPVGNRYSKRPVKLIESGVDAANWLKTVRNAVQVAISRPSVQGAEGAKWLESVQEWRRLPDGYAPYEGPVTVELIALFVPYPSEIETEADLPLHPYHGDTDKLERAIGDGLEQGGLIRNDRQITTWNACKRFVGWPGAVYYPGIPVGQPGAFVRVRQDDGA